ncbi:MAG TPA: porin [Vicinamibacterales bacterium]|nr:porin [Vicinamibacterales bacterium]
MELVVRHVTPLCLLLLVAATPALGQSSSQAAEKKEPSTYDKIWGRFTNWYDDKENPVVQRVLFTGRYHHDWAIVEADQGDHKENNVRRVRFGPRITMFRNFLVHAEVEVNPQEREPFYMRFTDAYVQWTKNPALVVTVGKHSVPFTQEGATSSRELLTIDRSNLANNIWFGQEYMPGLSVAGRKGLWNYRGSVYSAGAMNREFGEFTGGLFTMAILGYDLSKKIGVREASVTGNYLYQQPDANNTFTRRYEHITSVHFRFEEGRVGTRGDLATAVGYLGQRDVWSFMLMPYFNATDKLQFVGRYTFVDSDGNNGVSLPAYENRVVTRGAGDEYNAGYLGVNYYFYGHRLKLQSGVEFAKMQDRANDGGAYSGTSWVTGLRVGW